MADDTTQPIFDEHWPAEQRAAINEAVRGRTVESLEVGEASGYQYVLITFADGLQLRIECEHLEAIDPIQPQHI